MEYKELNAVLKENIASVAEKKIRNYTLSANGLTFSQLRDALIVMGRILLEDTKTHIYVARVNGGFLKKNSAYLALYLDNDSLLISAYAKEGIINQHTCEGAINELKKFLGRP